MTHSWCSDPARDEAVRAAEDRRQGPLPTLEEAIADPFAKKARIRETESAVEPAIPAADAQGGRGGGLRTEQVTNRRPVDAGWGENVTGGLRTERVTLEVTHQCFFPAAEWVLEIVRMACSDPGEYVRVVEERAERITQALTADRFASAVAEADRLRARVAELEAAPAASGWLTEEEREMLKAAKFYIPYGFRVKGVIDALLARSSPPEVVLPKLKVDARDPWVAAGYNAAIEDCGKALASAGVAVKEVGK